MTPPTGGVQQLLFSRQRGGDGGGVCQQGAVPYPGRTGRRCSSRWPRRRPRTSCPGASAAGSRRRGAAAIHTGRCRRSSHSIHPSRRRLRRRHTHAQRAHSVACQLANGSGVGEWVWAGPTWTGGAAGDLLHRHALAERAAVQRRRVGAGARPPLDAPPTRHAAGGPLRPQGPAAVDWGGGGQQREEQLLSLMCSHLTLGEQHSTLI